MRNLIGWWIVAKSFAFIFCFVIFLPFGMLNASSYFAGARGFFSRTIDEFEKHYPELKEECDKLRKENL